MDDKYTCAICNKEVVVERKGFITVVYPCGCNGKIKMVYKDLAFLGPESAAAAEAAQCAVDQKKYWQYHDALYTIEYEETKLLGNGEGTGNLNRSTFEKIASGLEMDTNQFLNCFDSKKYVSEVQKDIEEAKAVMDSLSTPTIFVNDRIFQGALPYSVFKDAIDAALIQAE